jgi:hypothetical protein
MLFSYWALLMVALGMFRWDHLVAAGVALLVAFSGEKGMRFFKAFAGFAVVGWMYDASRFIRDMGVTPDRVLLCNLREIEAAIFGITADGRRQTLQDFFFAHHQIAADVFFSAPYGLFVYIAAAYAVYLFVKDERACARYCWAFCILNVLGFITYHIAPAAPPWYFHQWGCSVNLNAPSSEGPALARVDALLGMSYFRGFYGRAAEVFGAVPSLHVAYPLLIVVEGWRRHGKIARAVSIFYFAWMCCAAVYLDHHWVVDIVFGWAYCLVVVYALRKLMPLHPKTGDLGILTGERHE